MCTIYSVLYFDREFIYVADDGAAGPGTNTTGATIRLPRDSTSMLLEAQSVVVARPPPHSSLADRRVVPRDGPESILSRTERGFLNPRPSSIVLFRSFALFFSRAHPLSLSLRSRPAREAEFHAYNPFARPSFLPTFAPPAALRVVDEDNDATTAAIPRCHHFHV